MKNIKCFKYIKTNKFNQFIEDCGYAISEVKGFSLVDKEQHNNNVLKTYEICFKDGESISFKVVYFNSFNEYRQSALGFNGNKLLNWFQDSNIKIYKVK